MKTLIHERVDLARRGESPWLIAKLPSGWAVMGDVQFPPGYTLLLADPVVGQLNDLASAEQTAFLTDMARLGQAVLTATKAARINYEIQGNSEAALHAHVFARYDWEPDEYRRGPVWRYPSGTRDVPYNATDHGTLRRAIASALGE